MQQITAPLTSGKQVHKHLQTLQRQTAQTHTQHQVWQTHCRSLRGCNTRNIHMHNLTNVYFTFTNKHAHTHTHSLTLAQGGFLEVHTFAYICMFNEFGEIKRSERPFVGISFFSFFSECACMHVCVRVCVCVEVGWVSM